MCHAICCLLKLGFHLVFIDHSKIHRRSSRGLVSVMNEKIPFALRMLCSVAPHNDIFTVKTIGRVKIQIA